MEKIRRIGSGAKALAVVRIAHRPIEVNYGVELLAGANPLVRGNANLLAGVAVRDFEPPNGVSVAPATRMPWRWARAITCGYAAIKSSAVNGCAAFCWRVLR